MSDAAGLVSEIESLSGFGEDLFAKAGNDDALEAARIEVLGRKGRLAAVMSRLPGLDAEGKKQAGSAANKLKAHLEAAFERRRQELAAAAEAAMLAGFDPSMPGRGMASGARHPLTLVSAEICAVFERLGFDVALGPEIETDFYNFEALNFPPEHPARDMQDTLYITDKVLLRTHTSPIQARTMLSRTPPLAVVAPGKVYRRDSDLTHSPMFHQIEGFVVDEGISMADLRGTLTAFVHAVFGADTLVRFRPSFFPFTEPSAEVDISCVICQGKGRTDDGPCRVCKGTGWVEILGCGMIDPNVFTACGYDPERYSGFAFGMGVERVTMLKYRVGDLRLFFENDIRFISQFRSLSGFAA